MGRPRGGSPVHFVHHSVRSASPRASLDEHGGAGWNPAAVRGKRPWCRECSGPERFHDTVEHVSDGARVETSDRILEGALRALGRHGVRKLGMSDISESAGVSRGTLYRYFSSKEELLEALARYEQRRFETGLGKALADAREGMPQLHATIDYAVSYLREHPALERLLESEPRFVLQFLREQLPGLRRATLRSLRPVLEASRPVRSGAITSVEAAELLLRVLVFDFLVPGDAPETDARTLRAFVDLLGAVGGGSPPDGMGRVGDVDRR